MGLGAQGSGPGRGSGWRARREITLPGCLLTIGLLVSPGGCLRAPIPTAATDNAAAESYVRLVLALGQHDAAFVDAYYGPPEWRTAAEQEKRSLSDINKRAAVLEVDLRRLPAIAPWRPTPSWSTLRRQYLARQLNALRARVAMLQGRKFPFDEESRELYDAVAPRNDEASFQAVIDAVARAHRRQRRPGAPLRRVPRGVRHPDRQARRRVPGGDRRVPPAHPGAPGAAARRAVHRGLREGQAVERLQLVPGRLRQPDRGEHRPAGLHRPRHRSGVSRGLSRPPRLQRAARTAPGDSSAAGSSSRSTRCSRRSRSSPRAPPTTASRWRSATPSGGSSSARRCFRWPGSIRARVDEYYDVLALTKRLSYAGNEAARGYLDGRMDADPRRRLAGALRA